MLCVVKPQDAGQSHLFWPSITNSRRVYSALCRSCSIPPGQGFLALYSKMSSGKPEMMSCTIWWGSSLRWFWLQMITVSACMQAKCIAEVQDTVSLAISASGIKLQISKQVETSEMGTVEWSRAATKRFVKAPKHSRKLIIGIHYGIPIVSKAKLTCSARSASIHTVTE